MLVPDDVPEKPVTVSALPVSAPMKVEAVRAFVVALYVNPASVAGERLPV